MSPLLTHCDPSVPIGHLSEASSSYWRKDGDLGTFSSLMEEKRKRSLMQVRQHMLLQQQTVGSEGRGDTHSSLSAACSGLVFLLG